MTAVACFVDGIKMRATVEDIFPARVAPFAGGADAVDIGHQRGGAIHHGSVDNLPLPGFRGLEQRADDAEGQVHAAASEIADQVERNSNVILGTDSVQRAGKGDVIDIMPRGLRQRAILPPSGDATIDQLRVCRQAFIRPESQPLHHPWPEAFDQRIGRSNQPA